MLTACSFSCVSEVPTELIKQVHYKYYNIYTRLEDPEPSKLQLCGEVLRSKA